MRRSLSCVVAAKQCADRVTRVFTSAECHRHDPGFPESPARLRAVLDHLHAALPGIVTAVPAAPPELLEVRYSPSRLAWLASQADLGLPAGEEIELNPGSWHAVLGATGAVAAAVKHAMITGEHAFAAIRPPGHHASDAVAMGFCVTNNVVVAASLARTHGARRVLIIDWDVHHGNGTQDMVDSEIDTRFVSMHQSPWYPDTGHAEERGVGNIFNVPMPPDLPREEYVDALWAGIKAATTDWVPDVILISAGYDAMAGDPLAGFTLEPEDYATWIARLRDRFPDVPMVGCMEGGYIPSRLADGVLATVEAMRE